MAPRSKTAAELKLLLQIDDLREEIHSLKAEVDALKQRAIDAEVGESSGLTEVLPESEAEVVSFVEGNLLRGLTAREAYYLGQMIQGFGPARCMTALRKKSASKEPIRAAYAMLQGGAMGQPAAQKEVTLPVVKYRSLDDASY